MAKNVLGYQSHKVKLIVQNKKNRGNSHHPYLHTLNPSPNMEVLECISFSVDCPSETLQFVSAYISGASHLASAFQKFKGDLTLLLRQSSNFFICGHSNSSRRANQTGGILFANTDTENLLPNL
jgi:hypothetical protein